MAIVCSVDTKGAIAIWYRSIDCDSSQALSQFQGINLPTTVSYSSGRPGRGQFLYYVDRPIKSFKLGNGLEVRGENLPSTLPPSVHPITGEYHWLVQHGVNKQTIK